MWARRLRGDDRHVRIVMGHVRRRLAPPRAIAGEWRRIPGIHVTVEDLGIYEEGEK